MRVFDESFELLEFVVYAVYVNLQNDEIVRIVRVVSEFGTTLSMCCVCVGSAVAVGVAIVVFSVTWVFVADGELTGTGGSAALRGAGGVSTICAALSSNSPTTCRLYSFGPINEIYARTDC